MKWSERQPKVCRAVSRLSGDLARAILEQVVDKIVTDTAGNSQNPFAYMWAKDWATIEEQIMRERCEECDESDS